MATKPISGTGSRLFLCFPEMGCGVFARVVQNVSVVGVSMNGL